jgi:hypothetical protein
MLDQVDLNPKHEIPAFAGAASRRQAKFEIISNDPKQKLETEETINVLNFGHLDFGFARPVK